MPTPQPREYTDLGWHLAQHLHKAGVVTDPANPGDDAPGIAVGGWTEQHPDTCVSIIGPWETDPDSLTVPNLRFMVAVRAPAQRDMWAMRQQVHQALRTGNKRVRLTADVSMLNCARVVSDPPVPDQNRNWVAVDTYVCRPYRDRNHNE